jgi:hypothetical protein
VSDPTPSGEDRPAAQPTTREIPVVQPGGAAAPAPTAPPLPPHPGALPPAPVAPPEQPAVPQGQAPGFDGPQETGPVDFVPGLPGVGTPAPPLPVTGPEPAGATSAAAGRTWPDTLEADAPAKAPRVRAPQSRAALLGIGLAVLALVLLELGLGLGFGGRSLWSLVPLWSAFATVAALLALTGFVPVAATAGSGLSWRIAAGGLAGLAVFWLLVVLPHADTNRGFVLTAALGALGAGLWMGPARSR